MATAHAEERIQEHKQEFLEAFANKDNNDIAISASIASFKFNANAPEFVPRSSQTPPVSISGYFVPCFSGTGGTDWIYRGSDQDTISSLVTDSTSQVTSQPKTVLTEELQKKILKQMEYQFGDMSLLANDNLAKLIKKDPGGFVPISSVASTKKIKSLVGTNHQLLAQALRASLKLDVSSDGMRVKRKVPFTKRVKAELQLRTVVAENLPDDHSHQNIEKIFNVAGCVKTIRICHPQDPSTRSKGDFIISTKLHALVEFENPDAAERAVEKLNDQRNWRKGLRVRCLLRRSIGSVSKKEEKCSINPKSVLKKKDFDGILEEEEGHDAEIPTETPRLTSNPVSVAAVAAVAASATATALVDTNNGEESSAASKKVWSKGRGKSRLRTQTSAGRGLLTPQLNNSILREASARQTVRVPRTPDGTRGFTMGRGRPLRSPPPTRSCAAAVV